MRLYRRGGKVGDVRMELLPKWVVLHVPHHSSEIPEVIAGQFLLDAEGLRREVIRMTDHLTLPLFAGDENSERIVVAPVSRLVVDVERFPNDQDEPMSQRGMGVIYSHTADGLPLRCPVSDEDRQTLLDAFYAPHHDRLISAVRKVLESCVNCLIIDAHSFPSMPLPYENDQEVVRPDICIGTDNFHTPDKIRAAFIEHFSQEGFSVSENRPFAGAMVPAPYYREERRVMSIMVEVNRGLYIDEDTGLANSDFGSVSDRVRRACRLACEQSLDGGR